MCRNPWPLQHDGPDAADYMERINISDVHEGHTCYQRSWTTINSILLLELLISLLIDVYIVYGFLIEKRIIMVRYCKALGDWEVSLKKNQIKKKKEYSDFLYTIHDITTLRLSGDPRWDIVGTSKDWMEWTRKRTMVTIFRKTTSNRLNDIILLNVSKKKRRKLLNV